MFRSAVAAAVVVTRQIIRPMVVARRSLLSVLRRRHSSAFGRLALAVRRLAATFTS